MPTNTEVELTYQQKREIESIVRGRIALYIANMPVTEMVTHGDGVALEAKVYAYAAEVCENSVRVLTGGK